MSVRGTRPTGPRPWPTQAEQYRVEVDGLAEEIERLADEAGRDMKINPYLAREKMIEVRVLSERIRRLLLQAKTAK